MFIQMDLFPDGVWVEILRHLSVSDISRISCVCKRFRMMIINYKLFEKIVYAETPQLLLEWFGQTKVYDYKLIYSYFKRSYNKIGHLQVHKIAINKTKLVYIPTD